MLLSKFIQTGIQMNELFFAKLTNFIILMRRNEKITLITKKILFWFLSILDSDRLILLTLLRINHIEL